MSALCPGRSRENSFVASFGSSLLFVGGGTLNTSREFVDKAVNNWEMFQSVKAYVNSRTYLKSTFMTLVVDAKVERANLATSSDYYVRCKQRHKLRGVILRLRWFRCVFPL